MMFFFFFFLHFLTPIGISRPPRRASCSDFRRAEKLDYYFSDFVSTRFAFVGLNAVFFFRTFFFYLLHSSKRANREPGAASPARNPRDGQLHSPPLQPACARRYTERSFRHQPPRALPFFSVSPTPTAVSIVIWKRLT